MDLKVLKYLSILVLTVLLTSGICALTPIYASELESTTESESDVESESIGEAEKTTYDHTTEGFVKRLYKIILLRDAEEEGLNYWVNKLQTGQSTGADVVYGFVFSEEFKNRNYDHYEYVERLYESILGRASDAHGREYWVDYLRNGYSRLYVCSGFIGSQEFTELCQTYGIVRGSLTSNEVEDQHPNITGFVTRLYNLVLNRDPETEGLKDWVSQLASHEKTAAEVVSGFVFSQEFKNKNLPKKDYLTVMYQTLLNRNPDAHGLATWMHALDVGMSETYILYSFLYSVEFSGICQEYDVIRGDVILSEPRDQNIVLTEFVHNAFFNCLGREASIDELNTFCLSISQNTMSAYAFLDALFFGAESAPANLSNEEFIQRLYATLLQREPTAKEAAEGIAALAVCSQKEVFKLVADTEEFENLLIEKDLFERYYQNPSGYYQIQDSIKPLTGGGYELKPGYMGVKVYMVQQKLGLVYPGSRAIVDNNFMTMVKYFQQSHGLTVDGIVGPATWKALGFSEEDWYNAGTYISPMLVDKTSSREDHIEAMISTAYTYLGTPYVIGASGKPGTGTDCSGLVMQGLYAAGMDLSPINPIRHSQPGYEYESRSMWDSDKFLHVPYEDRQRGDLIFYQNSYGVIIHVAIYLGDDQVIEAWPDKTVIWPIIHPQRPNIAGVVRPFV